MSTDPSKKTNDAPQEENDVSLETSDGFISSVEFGAEHDYLDYNQLTFWSLLGTGFVLVIIVTIMAVYGYTYSETGQQTDSGQFYDIQQLKNNTQVRLESFGVVDPDEGIYRIPVDSAISIMVQETE